MNEELQNQINRAAQLIDQTDCLVIAAGAGMGVDSGLPDFRGSDGFWKAYPALREAGLEFSRIASPNSFRTFPQRAWGFYGHRLALYRNTAPHRGYAILKRWSEQMGIPCSVFTSNVDGQFQKAGFDPANIVECHGSIHHLQCLDKCATQIWDVNGFYPIVDEARCELVNEVPRCLYCDSIARPNILMFSDWEWIDERTGQQSRRQPSLFDRIQRPIVIELGAGTAIPSVRHFSHRMIQYHGARLIRINPLECEVPNTMDVGIKTGALDALEAID
ncbi:MAG: NAD-dependent deacetylase, partial [Burkholderiales bacterium]|nr:NAD-dependent deacetylase [Burkholderiales bacterium]